MTNDKRLLIGLIAAIAATASLLVVIFAGGLGWWLLPPENRSAIHIEQLPPLARGTLPLETPGVAGAPSPEAEVAPVEEAAGEVSGPAVSTVEVQPSVTTPEPAITRLEIPALNLVAPIVPAPVRGESWQVDHLGAAVGHLQKTAAPGAAGNAVLAGHVSLAGGESGPFAGLSRLNAGDVVWVYQGGRQFEYVVRDTRRVDVAAVDVTYPTPQTELTLITCDGWNETEGRYTARLVVKADPVGD